MEKPSVQVGVGVFVIKNGKFLIQKRQSPHGTGTWSLPGGHMEFGESFEDTARREVKEECNLDIKNVKFCALTNDLFANENKHSVTVWMISDWAGSEVKNMEPKKCSNQEWRTLDDLPEPLFPAWNQLFKSNFIYDIKSKIK